MLPADLVAKLSQCAAADFGTPRDLWFSRLARFTTMVAVGLVCELPELAYELKGIAREWIPYFKYRIITRPRREHVAKVAAFVGWLLIVAGVAGERVAEVKVNDFDVSIQGCSDARIAELTQENTVAKNDLAATFMRTRPRLLSDNAKFQTALKGKPKADVEIMFKPEDEEAYTLGMQIRARLTDTRPGLGAGWVVFSFRPLNQSDALPDKQLNHPEVPLAIKSGAWYGLGFVVKSAPYPCFNHENDSPVCALQAALMASGVGGGQISFDPRMPANTIKIIVGQEESGH